MEASIAELRKAKAAMQKLYTDMDAHLEIKEKLKEIFKKQKPPSGEVDEMTLFYFTMVELIATDLSHMRVIMKVILSLDHTVTEKTKEVKGDG